MAAISAILGTFAPGTRTLAMNDVYGGTYRLFSKVLAPQGYTFEYADLSDLETVENALTPTDRAWCGSRRRPTRC